MGRVAVFVDAGYLFAQGSTALTGSKQPRDILTLNVGNVVTAFERLATALSGKELLRIYWYDGARQAMGLSQDHSALAFHNNIKLRLGFVNSQGQQKGVDSLIVTDLIELARSGAIKDAVLLSGDEDVRIGVQIAQSFGVRVHLLGIAPQRGSQSLQLLCEADTTAEWQRDHVAAFLSTAPPDREAGQTSACHASESSEERTLREVADLISQELNDYRRRQLVEAWKRSPTVPSDVDGRLLGKAGEGLKRDLTNPEKTKLRALFRERAKQQSNSVS